MDSIIPKNRFVICIVFFLKVTWFLHKSTWEYQCLMAFKSLPCEMFTEHLASIIHCAGLWRIERAIWHGTFFWRTCDQVASNVLTRGTLSGSRQVQASGPEPRYAESEAEKPPRAQWSGDVAGEKQHMIKHGCCRKLNNLPRTGKGVRASCGQGWGLHRSRQQVVKTEVQLDLTLAFIQGNNFLQKWMEPWCSHCHLKDDILNINYSSYSFSKMELVLYVIYSHIVLKRLLNIGYLENFKNQIT